MPTTPQLHIRKAAFIDRDGVINEEHSYVNRIEDFVFLPGAIDALRELQAAGYMLVVVTNQAGIARGLYTEADYALLTTYMQERLADAGVILDSVQYCPHLPDAVMPSYRLDCECRKPRPGMIQRAIDALGIDQRVSVLVGDKASDIAAGRAAGVGQCFLVRSGHELRAGEAALADGVFTDLAECVRALLLQA